MRLRFNKILMFSCVMVIALSIEGDLAFSVSQEIYCERYAKNAVEQYREFLKTGCKPKQHDPKWNSDIKVHRRWCMSPSVTKSMCSQENMERAQEIAACRNQFFTARLHERCEEYAERAVEQNIANLGLNCNFKGPMWSSQKKYHYDWCMKNRIAQGKLIQNSNLREEKLDKCRPYRSFEDKEDEFVIYISNEEGRFVSYADGFKDEFENTWQLTQYYLGECRALGIDHMHCVDSADLAFLAGHGSRSFIKFKKDEKGKKNKGCVLSNKSWGSFSSSNRKGDLEYIVFMSCKVLEMDDKWRDRWIRPFSGLHMALGYETNHKGTGISGGWEADEFAENLKDGLPVRIAWFEAVLDYKWAAFGSGNEPAVFYVRPHKNETLDQHESRDYKYGDPEYQLDAYYYIHKKYPAYGELDDPDKIPDSTTWW